MQKTGSKIASNYKRYILELLLPWVILGLLLVYSYALFIEFPYLGFDFSRGEVHVVTPPSPTGDLQVGDRLLQLGGIDMVAFDGDYRMPFLHHIYSGDTIPITLERERQIREIQWVVPDLDVSQVLERISSFWWISYVFWMAGTATLLFIRPRDARRTLLVAFFYISAIWLGAGSGPSHVHIWNSTLTLVVAGWFSLPVYLHLHWIFPTPFKKLPPLYWISLYALAGLLAVLEGIGVLPLYTFYYGFTLAALGSVLLLVARWIRQVDSRQEIQFLSQAVGIILLPPAAVILVQALGFQLSPYVLGGTLLAFPALPGAYFLVAYRQQFPTLKQRIRRITRLYLILIMTAFLVIILLSIIHIQGFTFPENFGPSVGLAALTILSAIIGFSPFLALPALAGESIRVGAGPGQIEIRANRTLAQFLFLSLDILIVAVILLLLFQRADFPGRNLLIATAAAGLLGITITFWLPQFQSFIDRTVLGIKVNPQELLMEYADRISTSLNEQTLRNILVEELLPSMLIRQSVLFHKQSGEWVPLVVVGLSPSQVPPSESVPSLVSSDGNPQPRQGDEQGGFAWIQLVIPLKIGGRSIGLWLFGRRDPDDFYGPQEIRLLENFASQTAIALTNLEQAARLRTLYESNIERQEEERKDLARMLHDQVLGQLFALSLNQPRIDLAEFEARYTDIIDGIRGVIATLRPAMLNYGLWGAFDEMVDELCDRSSTGVQLVLSIPKSEVRYDLKVEEHTYRIIQQAIGNALLHAEANTIRLSGHLEQEQVQLMVEDDGIGLPFNQRDLDTLVTQRHFGLVGMFERAELIGANLQIKSSPGKGTRILLTWKATPPTEGATATAAS